MKRTTIFVEQAVECDLKALAHRRGKPVAELVREALVEYVAREKSSAVPKLRFVGMGKSDRSDTAERHEEVVFANLQPHDEPQKRPAPRRR